MLFVRTIILILALLLIAVSSTIAGPITIKLSHTVDENTPKGRASEYFKRLVEQRSDRRILVDIHTNGSLFAEQDMLEALKFNAIQMAAPKISKLAASLPQLQRLDLPFVFDDVEHLHSIIDGEIGQRLLKTASRDGLVALSFWDNGLKQLSANRHLNTPQDIAGLSLGTQADSRVGETFRKLGAKVQTIPPSEFYPSLVKGLINGQENTLADIYSQGLYRVQSELLVSNHGYRGYLVMTNSRFWTGLPKDLQVIIQGAIRDAAEYTREMAIQADADALSRIIADGTTRVHTLTRQERAAWRTIFSGNVWH